ncbi:hypothetical protein VPH35_128513 [Triticum aestivum]
MKRKKKEALRGEAAPTIGIRAWLSWGVVALAGRRRADSGGVRQRRAMKFRGHVSAYGGARHRGERGGAARRHGGCGAPAWRRGGLHVMRRLTARGGGHRRRGAAGGQLRCDAARFKTAW